MTIAKFLVLILVVSVATASVPAHASATYAPRQGDTFSYSETIDLGSGTGQYSGYTEHQTINGMEKMNQIYANGTVGSTYSYTWTFSNSSGSSTSGTKSGSFTWSPTSFLYENGNDSQTDVSKPLYVWFYMANSTGQGGSFRLLNTQMTVSSTSYSYHLTSQNAYVTTIKAQGTPTYYRNDVYGQFNAIGTWNTYFDPSTGYIIGYDYTEQDTSPSQGFTWTETFYVTQTSYALTPGVAPSNLFLYIGIIAALAIVILLIVAIFVVVRSRRHPPRHPPSLVRPPPTIDFTPAQQPPVQQIVVKEVVKVKCRYCGALIDSTVQSCPFCGAPRT